MVIAGATFCWKVADSVARKWLSKHVLCFTMCSIKWDESTTRVMNYLSQEMDTLSDFRNLLVLNGYPPCLIDFLCLRIVRFLACNVTDAVVPGQSNPQLFLLLCLFFVCLSCRSVQVFFSFLFSCFKSFKIEYFGLSHNCSHNLPEAVQQYWLNEALIWGSVLVLTGDCIFAFGDHFFFDSRQKAIWNFFKFRALVKQVVHFDLCRCLKDFQRQFWKK